MKLKDFLKTWAIIVAIIVLAVFLWTLPAFLLITYIHPIAGVVWFILLLSGILAFLISSRIWEDWL